MAKDTEPAYLCADRRTENARFCRVSSEFDLSRLAWQLRYAGAQAVNVPIGHPEGEPGPGAV